MLLYNKASLRFVFALYGSPFPRTFLLAALSATFGVLTEAYGWFGVKAGGTSGPLYHPYPFQVFAWMVGFLAIFRTQLAHGRYWDGRTALTAMSSKWSDAVINFRSYCRPLCSACVLLSVRDAPCEELCTQCGRIQRAKMVFTHNCSLMHALALQTLRGDDIHTEFPYRSQDNIVGCTMEVPLAKDLRKSMAAAELVEEEKKHKSFSMHSNSRGAYASMPPLDQTYYLSFKWKIAQTFAQFFSQRHVMRLARKNKLQVLGGLLKEEEMDLFSGFPPDTERVQRVMEWQTELLGNSARCGILDAPGPVISRAYHVLSDGNLAGFMSARKIAETPFPFPYAQAVTVLIFLFIGFLPLIMATFLESTLAVGIATFLVSWSYLALNEVARELEDPFIGTGPNSLPLAFYQWQFNRRIEMVTKLGFHDGSKQSFRDDPGQRLSEPILGRESSERSGLSRRSQ
ncbi:hypothetical protein TeGR_g5911, partial [Tetraparma gracilis]